MRSLDSLALAALTLLVFACASQPVTAGEELRLVRGTIAIDGEGKPVQHSGAGWSVAEIQKGEYEVTFATAFPSGVENRPSVVVSGNQDAFVITPGVGNDSFRIRVIRPGGQPDNIPVHFVAVGPSGGD